MRNARVENGYLVYDCDGVDCTTPGVPHKVSVVRIMAAMESTYRELAYHNDPRLEELCVTMQWLWQTLFPAGTEKNPFPTDNTEWDDALKDVLTLLADHYATDKANKRPPKEMLN